ncbi:hypothetical protein F2Q68_00034474 [Brassica cretica]|uniref:Uncharacterized protein n=1 Tax=Brassica cretica TaxID=69181 RepID=A0A8S9H981_BRACR|nr:hypothetical protein F2Q68_00034474 [Brassica cretica]KAF3484661.1 hypothetical protein F2Q69_00053263 [Brassica cretica]
MLGQENVTTKHETSDKARKGSLRNDRTRVPLSRYVATERLFCSVDKYRSSVCSARSISSDRARAEAWSLRSDRALPKRRYDISPCILVYPSMLSPEDRSEPISCFPPF